MCGRSHGPNITTVSGPWPLHPYNIRFQSSKPWKPFIPYHIPAVLYIIYVIRSFATTVRGRSGYGNMPSNSVYFHFTGIKPRCHANPICRLELRRFWTMDPWVWTHKKREPIWTPPRLALDTKSITSASLGVCVDT
jgi:hypothetical protein